MVIKKFKILSIDGGGIRGVFPAKFLSSLEDQLIENNITKKRLCDHFDLICGTSTGGIIALALALGISAKEIHHLYMSKADVIFGNAKGILGQLFNSKYQANILESEIKKVFSKEFGCDPIINDCLTNLCLPIYDLSSGKPNVLKTKHHKEYNRDYHIPAYQAAMATAAAPTYFSPYSSTYITKLGTTEMFSNKVDGGVFANNPTLIGITEAQQAFNKSLDEIAVLSIGTGVQPIIDAATRKRWGIWYWLNNKEKRIIDILMQSQSQHTENLVSLLHKGIGRSKSKTFDYLRINTVLDNSLKVELDDTRKDALEKLSERSRTEFQKWGSKVMNTFID